MKEIVKWERKGKGQIGRGSKRLFNFFCNSQDNCSLRDKLQREDVTCSYICNLSGNVSHSSFITVG